MTELNYMTKLAIRTRIQEDLQAETETMLRNTIAAIYSDPLTAPDDRAEVLKFCERLKVRVTVEVS